MSAASVAPTTEDLVALRAEVERFAAEVVAPRARRPEQAMTEGQVVEILEAADALGLIGAGVEISGLGLWESLFDGSAARAQAFAVARAILVPIAARNVAIAWSIHTRSLARALCRALGLGALPITEALPFAHHGLGRDAWARWIASARPHDDDRALLDDAYDPRRPRLSCGLGPVAPLIAIHRHDSIQWATGAATLEELPRAHGLDELRSRFVALGGATSVTALAPGRAREIHADAIAASSHALTAIARGALSSAGAIARAHAKQRRQGGALIERHDAVALLLSRGDRALRTADASLSALGGGSAEANVIATLSARADLVPAITEAAHDALQVLGGLGYMRDVGVEKVVRDLAQLRAIGGSPRELALIVATAAAHETGADHG